MKDPENTPRSSAEADSEGVPGDYTETDFGKGGEESEPTAPGGEGEYTETDFGGGAEAPAGGKGEYTETDFGGGSHREPPKSK